MTPLPPDALFAPCDPTTLPFTSTAELAPGDEIVGQPQALRALELGLALRVAGYNLFVVGEPRTGKHSILRRVVARRAATEPTAPDLCYLHNFDDPDRPVALELPAGRGHAIRRELAQMVDDFALRLPKALDSESHARSMAAIDERAGRARDQLITSAESRLGPDGFRLEAAGSALDLVPTDRDGHAYSEEAFLALPAARRAELDERGRVLRAELEPVAAQLRVLERDAVLAHAQLARDAAGVIARAVTDEARARIGPVEGKLARHLEVAQNDLATELAGLLTPSAEADEGDGAPAVSRRAERDALLARYVLHVVVDRSGAVGAPVIEEPNPSYANLFGRIDRTASFGVLETRVTGIKAGALHRARGGYLLLDAAALVEDANAWAALKRALRQGEIRVEEQPDEQLAVGSLHPEPIPLDAKVILVGTPELYLALFEADDALPELFKVKVELDDTLERTPSHELALGRFVARAAVELGAPPLRAAAVAALIEHSSREAGHQRRLSARLGRLHDLIVEAGHGARVAGHAEVLVEDVARAIAEREDRARLLERTLGRLIEDGTLIAHTSGTAVGAVNGMALISVGERAFGMAQRVTASARAGRRGIVDINRQVGLAGAYHARGVLMLAGYLAGHFVPGLALAVHASIAIEQTYGLVEGDSASLAELCALLSAIGDLPVRQDLAVTGAVSQLGEVLAVGDVTLKIEGFFALCQQRGLTGGQGVIVPRANVQHLMLRPEIVDAARAGRFSVHAVERIDEAVALLTGRAAGVRGPEGEYPRGTANAAVEDALARWAPVGAAAAP